MFFKEVSFIPDNIKYPTPTPSKSCGLKFSHDYEAFLSTCLARPCPGHQLLTDGEKLSLDINPKTSDLAKLAELAYKKYDDIERQLKLQGDKSSSLGEYRIICCAQNGSYHASLFFREGNKHRHRQLIIAHRGTERLTDYQDWYANLHGVVKNQVTPQINSACTFTIDVLEAAFSLNTEQRMQIIIIGHSLGGWLAQISTFAAKHLSIDSDSRRNVFKRLEEDRCHPHCEVFDSPGAQQILYGISTLDSIRREGYIGSNPFHLDITNFVFYPNMINVMNVPFGEVIQIGSCDELTSLPSTILSIKNIRHTLKCHDIKRFVKTLCQSVQELGSEVEPESSDQVQVQPPFLKRVTNWPLVIFENWNTKRKYVLRPDPLSVFVKWMIVGINDVGLMSAMNEYKDWLGDKLRNYSAVEMNNSLSYLMLSRTESKLVDQFRQIGAWFTYFGNIDQNKEFALTKKLKSYKMLDWGYTQISLSHERIHFPSGEAVKAIKNCALFAFDFKDEIAQLPDHDLVTLICKSERYTDQIRDSYLDIKFETPFNFDSEDTMVITHDDEAYLRLVLLKMISQILQDEDRLTLVLEYDRSLADFRTDQSKLQEQEIVRMVIVNCIDFTGVVNTQLKFHNCKHIWITKKPESYETAKRNRGDQSEQFLENLTLNVESFYAKGKLMQQGIDLQGHQVPLNKLIPNSQVTPFQNFLNNNPNCLIQLLEKKSETKLKIGKMPKSLFEYKSNYLEVGRVFESDEELKSYFGKEGDTSVAVVFSNETRIVLQRKIESLISRYIIIQNDPEYFTSFQKICEANPDLFLDLIFYKKTMQKEQFKHRFQYNPKFYLDREVVPPALEVHDICNSLSKIEGVEVKLGYGNDCAPFVSDQRTQGPADKLEVKGNTLGWLDVINNQRKCVPLQSGSRITFSSDENGCQLSSVPYNEIPYFRNSGVLINDTKIVEGKQLLIISDEPGMGKSTTAVKLATELTRSKKSPTTVIKYMLVYLIELKQIRDLLTLIHEGIEEQEGFLTSFSEFLASYFEFDCLSKYLIKSLVQNQPEELDIVLICDGFDEMLEENKRLFSQVLIKLRRFSRIKLIVSTRQHDKERLECSLGVLAHHFKEIETKVEFLENWWMGYIREGGGDPIVTVKVKEFSKSVIQHAKKYLESGRVRFLGVPLQLKMLSEVFLQDVRTFALNPAQHTPDPKKYSLLEIYEKYIQRKYEIYLLQKLGYPEQGDSQTLLDILASKYAPYLAWVAGLTLNLGNDFNSLVVYYFGQLAKKHEGGILTIGILHKPMSKSVQPQFLHRTFAEFHVAKLLFCIINDILVTNEESQNTDELKQLLYNVFVQSVLPEGGWVIRIFLNSLISGDQDFVSHIKSDGVKSLTNKEYKYSLYRLDTLIRDRQAHLLAFVIYAFDIPRADLEGELQSVRLNLLIFFLKDLTTIAPVLVILHCLKQKFRIELANIKLFHNPRPYTKSIKLLIRKFRPGTGRIISFGYSIQEAYDLFNGVVETLDGSITREEFICMNPCAAILLGGVTSVTFLNELEVVVSNWGGEFTTFPYPNLQISSDFDSFTFKENVKEMCTATLPTGPLGDINIFHTCAKEVGDVLRWLHL